MYRLMYKSQYTHVQTKYYQYGKTETPNIQEDLLRTGTKNKVQYPVKYGYQYNMAMYRFRDSIPDSNETVT